MIFKNILENFPIKGFVFGSLGVYTYTNLVKMNYDYKLSVYRFKLEHVKNINSEIGRINQVMLTTSNSMFTDDHLDLNYEIPEEPIMHIFFY
jgi:hypothetical protein